MGIYEIVRKHPTKVWKQKKQGIHLAFFVAERARLEISALPRASLHLRTYRRNQVAAEDSQNKTGAHYRMLLKVLNCGKGEIRTRGRVTPTTV